MRKHRSRKRTAMVPPEVNGKTEELLFDETNHPNPSFDKEGLRNRKK